MKQALGFEYIVTHPMCMFFFRHHGLFLSGDEDIELVGVIDCGYVDMLLKTEKDDLTVFK